MILKRNSKGINIIVPIATFCGIFLLFALLLTEFWFAKYSSRVDLRFESKLLRNSIIFENRTTNNLNSAILIQYYNNPSFVKLLSESIISCLLHAKSTQLVVNIDDHAIHSREAWMTVFDKQSDRYENITLIFAPNIHELRAYNIMSQIVSAVDDQIDFIFLLQDDDMPPTKLPCLWIETAVDLFRLIPSVGVIGMNVGEIYGNHSSRRKDSMRCLRPPLSESTTLQNTPLQFACTVDIGPLAIRKSLFSLLGGFDTTISPKGLPGIGLDFDFCWRAWAAGAHVIHMPISFRRRVTDGRGLRNTQVKSKRRELHKKAQERLRLRYNESLRDHVAQEVRRLNNRYTVDCGS